MRVIDWLLTIFSFYYADTRYYCDLCRIERLPGIPSSKLGLDSLSGTLDSFSFNSYLNLPGDSEVAPPDLHTVMEKKLGMTK